MLNLQCANPPHYHNLQKKIIQQQGDSKCTLEFKKKKTQFYLAGSKLLTLRTPPASAAGLQEQRTPSRRHRLYPVALRGTAASFHSAILRHCASPSGAGTRAVRLHPGAQASCGSAGGRWWSGSGRPAANLVWTGRAIE